MKALCGWFAAKTNPANNAGTLESIRRSLRGDPYQVLETDLLALAGSTAAESFAHDSSSKRYAALIGNARWTDARIAETANRIGEGAALLDAYDQWEDRLLERLMGDFLLVVVDETAREMLIAVDRMGIQPCCFSGIDEGVVFGSTADLVLASGLLDDDSLSMQAIYNYIYFHVVPSPATIYKNVSKLEPAHFLRLSKGRISTERYWEPQFATRLAVSKKRMQQEVMDCLRSAVARQDPAERSGAFLSGGLDSSTVCGLANDLHAEPLRAYTIGFDQQGYDEMEFARAAAEHFGLNLRAFYVTPLDIVESIDVVANAYDEPFGNSSAIPAYFCAKHAREEGVDVLLAGDGGDELFAGNERYATQYLFDYYARIPSVLRRTLIEPTLGILPTEKVTLFRKASRYVEQARIPMPERMQTYNYLHLNSPADVFDSGFLESIDRADPLRQMQHWYEDGNAPSLLDRMLKFDWKLTLADNDIRKVNRMCNYADVSVAYPFLDDDLVALSARIPARVMMPNRRLRDFFRNTVKSYLPQKVIEKEKHGFGLPFGHWLRSSEPLQQVVHPSLESLKKRGYFRHEFIDELVRRHREDHAAYYGNIIWVLTILENWLTAHGR